MFNLSTLSGINLQTDNYFQYTSLSEKRLYVYRKTPKRFYKNALTFSLKRKYVLLQTQVRFDGNTRTFFQNASAFFQDMYNPLQKAS